MMTSQQIRQAYIDFFVQRHGHTFVPSSPVVPHDDPTLLFTNAGMNQFKPYFLGTEKAPWTRVANTQKCIRAGGKHNDLDDVGRSRRHHTFFEMLGNWSFGDYFKRGAIEMSWELLTKVFKLDPARLHVTCFEGDEKNGVPRDTETANLWKEIAGLPDDHIHYFGADNFWEMGDTGPCGPCTEIYIDRTPDKTGGPQVNGDDPRVMEIWNNVFIQYNRNPDRTLTTLPSQHVDTGMGFERISQVIQNVNDNYATDLWYPLFFQISQLSGKKYNGKFPKTNKPDPIAESQDFQLRQDIAFRVIADHARCLTFALTDGAVPSNEGRGYVLRRILRRAARFGRQQLELREPFMHKLVPVVIDAMGGAFPELKRDPNRVIELVKDEEVSFGRTLDRGIALFEDAAQRGMLERISGDDAFKLHDTYGFPIDLTRIMAEERGMSVDIAGYEKLMEEAKERARAGGKEGPTRLFELPPDVLAKLQQAGVQPTDDSEKFNAAPIGATVRAIWDGHRLIDTTHGAEAAKQGVAVILDKTNFYAEMGGQVGDTGELRSKNGAVMAVKTTRAAGGYVLHVGDMIESHLNVGDHVTATLEGVRPRTEKNHTATHIANWALREVLGDAVQQKGSLVDPDKLRFDFSHNKALADEEIARVETLVNERIQQSLGVYAEVAPQEQALKIHGLRAVFGEKYPPMVRVVSIGVPVADLLKDPTNTKWREFSTEFCGGTHLKNAGDCEAFVITSEESVSKGIRRLTAVTGPTAKEAMSAGAAVESEIDTARTIAPAQLEEQIDVVFKMTNTLQIPLTMKRRAQRALAELQSKQKAFEKSQRQSSGASVDTAAISAKLLAEAATLGDAKLIVGEVPSATDEQLRGAMDSLRKKSPSHGILLGSAADGKVFFVAAVSDDLIAKGLKAGDWIRETAKIAGGGGGGKPQMAQAGGKDPSKLADALNRAREFAQSAVK
ncbi:MAG: alanyl-tRNA synthetase [Phycisphaerales bacterium]|jgi:alanyl-tRNA synthetase|nr:alanyl-tRNA synthetase [Phycisphaerales bacterium]